MKDKIFIKKFENKIKSTIKKYKLLDKNDKIIVACSGGKDSTSVLYILHKLGYDVSGLIIDLKIGKWSDVNLFNISEFCKEHEIKLHVIDLRDIFGSSMCYMKDIIKKNSDAKITACAICGVIKKWVINKRARELGATKVATGHNLDDEAQTIFLNVLKGSPELCLGTGPKIGVISDEKFVQRIKPLFFCSEADTKRYAEAMKFNIQYERCPCHVEGYRKEIRILLNEMDKAGTKLNIVNNFLKQLPELRKKYKTSESLRYCTICGEPSRHEVCKLCSLLRGFPRFKRA